MADRILPLNAHTAQPVFVVLGINEDSCLVCVLELGNPWEGEFCSCSISRYSRRTQAIPKNPPH